MRTPIMAGNWKMFLTAQSGIELVEALSKECKQTSGVEIVVCPAPAMLFPIANAIKGTNIKLGGQNMYPKAEGAYTGETSPVLLKELGCTYSILGHSERREYFGEDDAFINEKMKAAFEFNLIPILCVGESLEQREQNKTNEILLGQITKGFAGIPSELAAKVVVAYEPIWAIGTGKTATPELAEETHAFIRLTLKNLYDTEVSESIRIQYGGSVKPGNVDELMSKPNIDGALVGGASLSAESFGRIVNFK